MSNYDMPSKQEVKIKDGSEKWSRVGAEGGSFVLSGH